MTSSDSGDQSQQERPRRKVGQSCPLRRGQRDDKSNLSVRAGTCTDAQTVIFSPYFQSSFSQDESDSRSHSSQAGPHLCLPPAQIGVLRPGDSEVPKMVARLHHRMGQPSRAMEALEKHMKDFPGAWRCGGSALSHALPSSLCRFPGAPENGKCPPICWFSSRQHGLDTCQHPCRAVHGGDHCLIRSDHLSRKYRSPSSPLPRTHSPLQT